MPKRADKPHAEEAVAAEPTVDAVDKRAEPAAEPAAQSGNGAGTEAEPSIESLSTELEATRAAAADNWDRLLRTQAEMENLRKRSQRDIEHAHKYALEGFAGELLGVRDSLEMGLAAAEQEQADIASIREGTALTLKMLEQVMEKFSIRAIDPLGEKFDPEHHQAMTMVESDSAAPNTVLSVIQKGYLLNDRLIRPALVTVAKNA